MARLRYFPISYQIAGKTVVVAGGGEAALAKLRLLALTEAVPLVVSPELAPELAAYVAEHGIAHRAGELTSRDLERAALLFVASGEEPTDARLAQLGREAGVPVNVVDRPHLCDFAVPAIVDRAPVAVAISTDGAAPVLAQRLRAAIEALLPPEFGRLGELAQSLRQTIGDAVPLASHRRRLWAKLFAGRAADLALAGSMEDARKVALSAIAEGPEEEGIVWLIGAGPGAADLLTLRAQRLLQEADVIVHDRLVPEAVIAMGRRDAERISVGKAKGHHSVAQADIDALLVRLAREGKRVARLKAGDPLIFGRAGEELAALRQGGIRVEVVPGVTAALAAGAELGVPLTMRGVSSALVFATGHGADGREPPGWPEIARICRDSGATVAVYMGLTAAGETHDRLVEAGLAPDTPVAAVENAGRGGRRAFAGRLADLPRLGEVGGITGPVLILIGPAVAHGDLAEAEPIARPLAIAAE